MSNIPISQVVQVNPRVVGAGGAQSSLAGLLLTQNASVAISAPMEFYNAADVAEFFGPTSEEAIAAGPYFAGILGGGQLPGVLTFARYADVATPAQVLGATLDLTLAELQGITGVLVVMTDTEYTSSVIDLSAATSFVNAANIINAAFTTPNFTVNWDQTRNGFTVATVATGETAVIEPVVGSAATPLGLSTGAGAVLQAEGAAADTVTSAMNRIADQSSNWGLFTTVWAADIDERLEFAEWTSAFGLFNFGYVGWDTDGASTVANNENSFGSQVFAAPYQGTIPVYGDLRHAAVVLGWAAATNYLMTEGRNALAFRQTAAGVPASACTLAQANALLSNGYTYLGAYASANNSYVVFYNGALSGQFEWADTYLGQIWLRRSLQQALFETLLAYNTLPYNADGYNAIYQGAQDTIRQGEQNGVIRQGVTLSASQAAQINQQAGIPGGIADQVSTLGWYLQVADPLSVTVRTERGSPLVNFWYCDGGSIQRIVVSSTTVL